MDILRTSGNAQLVELWWLEYGHFPYFRANYPTLEKTVLNPQSLGVTHKIVRGKFAKSLNLGGMGRDLEPSH